MTVVFKVQAYIKHWKLCQNSIQFLLETVLCELDFSHIEVANTTDFKVLVNDLSRVRTMSVLCVDHNPVCVL